jgi:hypothetical protein
MSGKKIQACIYLSEKDTSRKDTSSKKEQAELNNIKTLANRKIL